MYGTLLLVGIILLIFNGMQQNQRRLDDRTRVSVDDEYTSKDVKVVYRYLPRDLDDYLRSGDVFVPSKMYSSVFTGNEDDLRRV
jgi:hypothetical protein